MQTQPGYSFGRIVSGGEVFLQHSPGGAWRAAWDQELDAALAGSGVGGPTTSDAIDGFVLVTERLWHEGKEVGALQLAFATGALKAARVDAFWRSTGVGVAFAAIMAAVVSLLLAQLLAPLTHLAAAVRDFSIGREVDCSAYAGRRDEIGELARAVDLMQKNYREARTDTLTGLQNRRALDDIMLAESKRGPYAVFLVDLDDFKPINDSYGHAAGDLVLQTVARRIQSRVAELGRVLRLGGDEFAIVISGLAERGPALEIAEGVADEICAPIAVAGQEAFIGASIGVALSSIVGPKPTDVISAADAAMYSVKHETTLRAAVYDPEQGRRRYGVKEWRELESALALEQIEPWFQPQYCLRTGRMVGMEALARWRHPERGVLAPGGFLPMIEELRLQKDLDLLMLRRSLAVWRGWRGVDGAPPRLSINLSEETLALKEGCDELIAALAPHEERREAITLEITENVFTARSADAIRRSLERLFEFGVCLSMDDFGTGYGSFRHLQEYDFHELKIDRRFVSSIGEDASSEVLIKGFLSIAAGLSAAVVAEGVETAEQIAFLRDQNCDVGQGYFFSKPLDAAAAGALIGDPPAAAGGVRASA